MTKDEILNSIENIKFIKPSSDYIPIRVGDLETLYTEIKKLEEDMEKIKAQKEHADKHIQRLNVKLKSINEMVECTYRPKRLDSFCMLRA